MSSASTLFRSRFPFVCDGCDFGYRAGRLAGWAGDHTLICATCLVGADPDNDPATTGQEYPTCSTTSPPAAATLPLFDDPSDGLT